jgi:hypothetical protein
MPLFNSLKDSIVRLNEDTSVVLLGQEEISSGSLNKELLQKYKEKYRAELILKRNDIYYFANKIDDAKFSEITSSIEVET